MGGRGPKPALPSALRRGATDREYRLAQQRMDRELAEADSPTVSEQLREYLADSHLTLSDPARDMGVGRYAGHARPWRQARIAEPSRKARKRRSESPETV